MKFDVVIVGGGPAGLSAAIRLKQIEPDLEVCLIEKGSVIGAHILSGAIIDPRALDELLPNWQAQGAPLNTPVSQEQFLFLTTNKSFSIPQLVLPACCKNQGNHVISLGQLCRWLSQQAEALGVAIYPGIVGKDILFDANDAVMGVITGDTGTGNSVQPGVELHARYTLFAEGCRGHLGKRLEAKYDLRRNAAPQIYGLGFKELWEIPTQHHQSGLVVHTTGWPLDARTYGGSFMYHYDENLVAVGFIIDLGYSNPYLSPFEEFQRCKTHPVIQKTLAGGRRIGYGARTLTAGGLRSLPALTFPGGALIGDDAGFLNVAHFKGSHTAIKSGMLAAEAITAALAVGRQGDELEAYSKNFRASWLFTELYKTRNFKPLMDKGLWLGSLLFGIDQQLFCGKVPRTFKSSPGPHKLKKAAQSEPINYPKPDGKLTFDRLSSVFLSNTHHEKNQPCHLQLKNPATVIDTNLALYDAPEQRYCPAGVYEIIRDTTGHPKLQINAQNCLHCKTCDIKDPAQNIIWSPPQGGEGPIYLSM